MKKCILILLIACSPVFVGLAFDRDDLNKLFETLSCPDGNLTGARLSGHKLKGANLKGADLSNADISNVDLSWANMDGAKLYGAKFENTTMPNGEKYSGKGEDYKGPLNISRYSKWGDSEGFDFTSHYGIRKDAKKISGGGFFKDSEYDHEDESEDEDESD